MLRCSLRGSPGIHSPLLALLLFFTTAGAHAGPFTDLGKPVGLMVQWATAVDSVTRGPWDIAFPAGHLVSSGAADNVLGASTGNSAHTISLGDGGSITLYLDGGISNGPGDDFAIFENGFFDFFGLFAELAYVEVASNGVDFAEFESGALNPTPVNSFGSLDPTDYFGLAGRHAIPLGTGFDLADLASDPLILSGTVDLTDVRYVRLTDVVGDGSTTDTLGNPIYDPYATAFAAGGFDLEAVGVIHVPEPSFISSFLPGALCLAMIAMPRRRLFRRGMTFAALSLFVLAPAFALASTFEDLGLGAEAFENGAGLGGSNLVSNGMTYENSYFPSFNGFAGFSASTTTDTTTPGFLNQYSNITGAGAGGSATFGINWSGGKIIFPSVQTVLGADFTNTTYAYLSILNGDSFTNPFGGATGNDADYFKLIIEGLDPGGVSTGTVEFNLADYTGVDNSLDYIVDTWTFVDLSTLGAVKELAFSYESTDVGEFGINTPTYFAIDNLIAIPEPSSALLLGLSLLVLPRSRRVI